MRVLLPASDKMYRALRHITSLHYVENFRRLWDEYGKIIYRLWKAERTGAKGRDRLIVSNM